LRIEREAEYNADCGLQIADWNKKGKNPWGLGIEGVEFRGWVCWKNYEDILDWGKSL
jgi:hypothetical protein